MHRYERNISAKCFSNIFVGAKNLKNMSSFGQAVRFWARKLPFPGCSSALSIAIILSFLTLPQVISYSKGSQQLWRTSVWLGWLQIPTSYVINTRSGYVNQRRHQVVDR